MKASETPQKAARQPAAQQRQGTVSLESPQGEQLAQLEAMANDSPQADGLAQLAAAANHSLQAAAQRRSIAGVHASHRATIQRQQLDHVTGGMAQREEAPVKPNDISLEPGVRRAIAPIQRIMNTHGMDEQKFKNALRSTVFLVAYVKESEGATATTVKAQTDKGDHAEGNLIQQIKDVLIPGAIIDIYLSTSPCSSEFGTRDDGNLGCMERLKEMANDVGATVHIHAAHYYQPTNQPTEKGEFDRGTASAVAMHVNSDDNFTADVARSSKLNEGINPQGAMNHDQVMQLRRSPNSD